MALAGCTSLRAVVLDFPEQQAFPSAVLPEHPFWSSFEALALALEQHFLSPASATLEAQQDFFTGSLAVVLAVSDCAFSAAKPKNAKPKTNSKFFIENYFDVK
jgi:hypothetical protein